MFEHGFGSSGSICKWHWSFRRALRRSHRLSRAHAEINLLGRSVANRHERIRKRIRRDQTIFLKLWGRLVTCGRLVIGPLGEATTWLAYYQSAADQQSAPHHMSAK